MIWRVGDHGQLYWTEHEWAGWAFDRSLPWSENVAGARDAALLEADFVQRTGDLVAKIEWIDEGDVAVPPPARRSSIAAHLRTASHLRPHTARSAAAARCAPPGGAYSQVTGQRLHQRHAACSGQHQTLMIKSRSAYDACAMSYLLGGYTRTLLT